MRYVAAPGWRRLPARALHVMACWNECIVLPVHAVKCLHGWAVNAGRTDGSMDAANMLKPALARELAASLMSDLKHDDLNHASHNSVCWTGGELHCLGATTPEEFRKHIESDPAFARRFQAVMVEEPSSDEAALWLRGLRKK